jgi:peptidoglycan/xylan/chitin deacetylase (PgdA/CDA1 family)
VDRRLRTGLKVTASAVDAVRRPGAGVVVLAFHQVDGPRASEVNLPGRLFEEQMAIVAEQADVIALGQAVDELAAADGAGSAPPDGRRRVVLTFDDGTADFVEHALPVVARLGLPVTLYVATDFVESGRSFWDDGTVLSWAALRDALDTGVLTVGSHTHSHALLDRLTPAVAAAELDRSIDLLGARLGVDAHHFAYPKALWPGSAFVEREVRARFRSAAVAGGGLNRWGATDPWRLARSPIQVSDGTAWFERKLHGGLWLEGALRERLAHRRYEKATR